MTNQMFSYVASAIFCFSLAWAQEPLTNDSVIKMAKAGLSEDVMVSMVKTQPAKYTLTPEQLIAMKAAGVPDRVVAAMVEKSAGAGAASPFTGNIASGATLAAGNVVSGDPHDLPRPTIRASTSTPRIATESTNSPSWNRPRIKGQKPVVCSPPPSLMASRKPR